MAKVKNKIVIAKFHKGDNYEITRIKGDDVFFEFVASCLLDKMQCSNESAESLFKALPGFEIMYQDGLVSFELDKDENKIKIIRSLPEVVGEVKLRNKIIIIKEK